MLLSVIILNYNVKHFLEQCLHSVQLAVKDVNAEIIVIDNNSSDGSVEYLKAIFPLVQFLENPVNTGFAKANNLAVQHASGDVILFLNPDTLIPRDSLKKCLQFLESQPAAGALGVLMLDGSGRFLPESKRSFPSPLVSMFKLTGLAALFPHSPLFARYHLGHLHRHHTHEVDVLSGAFFMARKKVLDTTGLFDEAFFMYGEDVDLSYRIQKAGWKNYYYSEVSIIHFKGESTKKGSSAYVKMFYQAMHLFVQKHYSSSSAGIFRIAIQISIWFRAALSSFGSFLKKVGLPLFDILITLGSLAGVAWVWQRMIKPAVTYRSEVIYLYLPLFTLSFIVSGAIAGLYDVTYKAHRAWLAMMIAVMVNLAIYSLLDIDYRFSRGVMLFGGLLASLGILLFRKILLNAGLITYSDESREFRQTLIAGSEDDYTNAHALMEKANRTERVLGRIGLHPNESDTLGSFDRLSKLLAELPAREIVFCIGRQLTLPMAMQFMQHEKRRLRYKFHYSGSSSIVGSDSKESTGETLAMSGAFKLALPENRRMKKVVDILSCIFLLVLFPLHLFFIKKPAGLIRNIFSVLGGKKTWVGYCSNAHGLPSLPGCVIGCNGHAAGLPLGVDPENLQTIDYWYAKDYEWLDDARILWKSYRQLGIV